MYMICETMAPAKPDFVIKFKLTNKSEPQEALKKLLTALVEKQFSYTLYKSAEPKSIFIAITCQPRRLRKRYLKSKTNDWLHGVGLNEIDPKESLEHDEHDLVAQMPLAERLRLVHEVLQLPESVDLWGAQEWKDNIEDLFCLHDSEFDKLWMRTWNRKWVLTMVDFDSIRNQFGEEIALYFAFLQFYCTWLVVPAILAVIVMIFGFNKVSYSLACCIWALLFDEVWSREERKLSLRWGTRHCSRFESIRPHFIPDFVSIDAVTGEKEKVYPVWKRIRRLLLTIPIIILMSLVLICLNFMVFALRMIMTDFYEGPLKKYATVIPSIAYAMLIPQFDKLYRSISTKLNTYENYATDSENESQMAMKLFISSFVLNFSSPLMYGLYFIPYGQRLVEFVSYYYPLNTYPDRGIDPAIFKEEIIYFILTGQIINLVMDIIVPYVSRWLFGSMKKRHAKTSGGQDDSYRLIQQQSDLPAYNVHVDYLELVMQYGYVLVFSSVTPITSIASFINNIVELRSDAMKICMNLQRPIPRRVESIGHWKVCIKFFSWLSVITNCIWVYLYDKGFAVGNADWTVILVEVVILEHIYLLLSYGVQKVINMLPSSEIKEMKRREWNVKMKYLRMIGDDEGIALVKSISSGQDLSKAGELLRQIEQDINELTKQQ